MRNISKSFVGSYPNSFAKFNDYYEKMVYYSSDQDIAVALNYLKDCLPFLFIPQNKKEYFEWKKEFSQILEEVLQKLKLNYEYEMKAGKELAMKLYNK